MAVMTKLPPDIERFTAAQFRKLSSDLADLLASRVIFDYGEKFDVALIAKTLEMLNKSQRIGERRQLTQ